MKNLFQLFRKNSTTVHITAMSLIICMGIIDMSLYLSYAFDTENVTDDLRVITEEHELENAFADGDYTGNNSDLENPEEGYGTVPYTKKLFSILEILPNEKMGAVGYTIGGCEPFTKPDGSKILPVRDGEKVIATVEEMREAYLDACVNPTPGASYNGYAANSANLLDNNSLAYRFNQDLMGAFGDGGMAPFKLETDGEYIGHYRYIGGNNGVFRCVSKGTNTAVMASRFYDTGSHNDYNYIFVYDIKSNKPNDINVEGHKRIRYINNEKFLNEAYGVHGDELKTFKDTHDIEVITRTPVSVSFDDIERADVIIMNNGDSSTMRYFKIALQIYNTLHGLSENDGADATFYNSNNPSKSVDFDNFEKVIRIYERVVVREDVAFIGSRTCVNGMTFNTNVRKLMCMLFYVTMKTGEIEHEWWTEEIYGDQGSGRDLFMNFLKRYVDEAGTYYGRNYMTLRQQYEDHKNDPDEYVRKKYVDYRAPSLRTNFYYDSNGNVSIPYMHTRFNRDPGHPLVKTPQEAIIGGYYDANGHLVPIKAKNASEATERIMRRRDTAMYSNDGLSWWEGTNNSGFKYYARTYMSMSNATDYVYIDDTTGNLEISGKYSGYWFNIDDDYAGGHDYKRIAWDAKTYTTWPWAEAPNDFKDWFIHISKTKSQSGYYDPGDCHLWFDYYVYGNYRACNVPQPGAKFRNQAIEGESGLFKDNLIFDAIDAREYKREKYDEDHKKNETPKKKYYISMNILNGDGVNKNPAATEKNKVLYFNEYEKDKITAKQTDETETYIPIKIRIKSTCHLNSIQVLSSTMTELASYKLNSDVKDEPITCTGTGTPSVRARTIKLEPKNEINPETGKPTATTPAPDFEPIYTYEGYIPAELSSLFVNKRNTTFIIRLSAEKPGGDPNSAEDDAKVTDTVTFVKRDFFMLD